MNAAEHVRKLDPTSQSDAVTRSQRIEELYDRSNLTKSQLLIWLGQRLTPQLPLYNMAMAFKIEAKLNREAFQAVFQLLINASDALRSVFYEKTGIPFQNVLPEYDYHIEIIDFVHASDTDLDDLLASRSKRLFDLNKPLFDAVLITTGHNEFVWFLNQHHLIADAWSTSLIYQHISHLYGLVDRGENVHKPVLPCFSDYVRFERSLRGRQSYNRARDYWLACASTVCPPVNYYGKSVSLAAAATTRVSHDLGADRSRKMRDLAATKELAALTPDLSVFYLFLTVLAAFLNRIGGGRTIAISTPIHHRSTTVFKDTVGLFIELYPVQLEIDARETFLTLYKKVKASATSLVMNAVPGSSIPESNANVNTVLNFIPSTFRSFGAAPMTTKWVHPGYGDRGHSLRLQVHDLDDTHTYQLHFDFNTDVFDDSKQSWAIDHFARIVDGALEDFSRPISGIALIPPEQEQFILGKFNDTVCPPRACLTCLHAFEELAQREPNAIALVHNGLQLRYGQLRDHSNHLADYLTACGVAANDVVAISLPRSHDFVIAVWAVLGAGAAFVPLDVGLPARRKKEIIENAACRIVLAGDDEPACVAAECGITMIRLPRDWSMMKKATGRRIARRIQPQDNAYILYTSGSSGIPKGVVINHAALFNYVAWAKQTYMGNEILDFPLFTSVGFDLTITSIFVPLLAGGRIVIYDEDRSEGDLSILRVLQDDNVDIIKLTPSHLSIVRDVADRKLCSRIRKFIVGGEDLKVDLARAITHKFGEGVEIYNEYGPTEATVGCMTHTFCPISDINGSVPIGGPIDNVQIYLLDDAGQLVSFGLVGEIHISGICLSAGYWQQDDLTRTSFIDHPFVDGERLYRTGDLGRFLSSGELEFVGRKDDQVKIRGARIELAEVARCLNGLSGIRESIICVYRDQITSAASDPTEYCSRCGIPAGIPHVKEITDGICDLCRDFQQYRDQAMTYFHPIEELQSIFEEVRNTNSSDYDCLMLLSGGKDSTYALYRLVEMGLRVLVFSMDNGFISEGAKENIRRAVDDLGLELIFGKTPAMNAIFVDSLKRFSNVCNGCFKTIYTLSTNIARERNIRYIVTGLSRGQIFETRLADLFRDRAFDIDRVDQLVIEARKAYHRMDDAVSQHLDVGIFSDDKVFEDIQFIDFYRYCDVELDTVMAFLEQRAPWIRPSDTGRSTNCLINNVGIYIHRKERGYHNYALPYSWDVRLGHKNREAAMQELNDQIDLRSVRTILDEIGYDENQKQKHGIENRLVAYYVPEESAGVSDIRSKLAEVLPRYMIPSYFMPLNQIPLTANGKVDYAALPPPEYRRTGGDIPCAPPATPDESILAQIWSDVLKVDDIGVHDNFFDLGGDSVLNIQITNRAAECGLEVTPKQVFEHPTIFELARVATAVKNASPLTIEPNLDSGIDAAEIDAAELEDLIAEFGEQPP